MTSQKSLSFAEATQLAALSDNTYSADLSDDWCIGIVPHGGYITGLFLAVAKKHFSTTLSAQNQPHTIALHLSFVRRTERGPALFTVRTVKLGLQTSVITISLSQHAIEEVICTLTQSNIDQEKGVTFDTKWKLDPPLLPIDFERLKRDGEDDNWRAQRETERAYKGFRKAAEKCVFVYPKRGQRQPATGDEWVRLSTGERWTDASVGFLADTWPMPVESFLHANTSSPETGTSSSSSSPIPRGAGRFWYPTLLVNLDVKKSLPTPGPEWLFVRNVTKRIRNGRHDIDIVIMDEAGEIVALSNHVALAVDVERNIKGRRAPPPGKESKI